MKKLKAIVTLLLVAGASSVSAQQPTAPELTEEMQRSMAADLEDVVLTDEVLQPFVPVYAPEAPKKAEAKVHFAWGANTGVAIDMSGNEMSSVELALAVGLRWKGLKFLGLGLQAEMMVSNSCRSYPIYAQIRTNFHDGPSLFFWDIRGGASINYLEDNMKQTGAYFSTGLGIVLAHSARFSSHIIIGYEFHSRTNIETEERVYNYKNLHAVAAKIGVTF